MTQVEQRKLERYPLDRQPDGKLVLRLAAARHAIDEIRDISDFGISIYLDQSLDLSAQVALEYADPKLKIEVYGRIAWCAPRSPAMETPSGSGYVLGIELLTPMLLYAVLQKH